MVGALRVKEMRSSRSSWDTDLNPISNKEEKREGENEMGEEQNRESIIEKIIFDLLTCKGTIKMRSRHVKY